MTLSSDRGNGQRRASVDAHTADRLLDGLISPEDAPAGFAGVARVVIAARRPASDSELADEDRAVAEAVRLLGTLAGEPHHLRQRIRPRRRFVRVKVVALAVVGAVLGTSGLAVAGVLPEPAQEVAAEVLSKVGIHAPGWGEEGDPPEGAGNEVSETAQTTDAEGAAKGAAISHLASGEKSHAGEGGLGREGAPGRDQPHGQGADNASENGKHHGSENGSTHGRSDEAGNPAPTGGPPDDAGTDPGAESDGAGQGAESSGEHAQGGPPPAGPDVPAHARND
jgi:hypothetical protein